eukprot:Gb_09167 [translate_table: standard]
MFLTNDLCKDNLEYNPNVLMGSLRLRALMSMLPAIDKMRSLTLELRNKNPYTSVVRHLAASRETHLCGHLRALRIRLIGMVYQPHPLLMPFPFKRNEVSRVEEKRHWRGLLAPVIEYEGSVYWVQNDLQLLIVNRSNWPLGPQNRSKKSIKN